MGVKITLSINEKVIETIKREAKKPISKIVEESLITYSTVSFLENFNPEFISPEKVKEKRRKGLRAEEVLRDLRDESLSRHKCNS